MLLFQASLTVVQKHELLKKIVPIPKYASRIMSGFSYKMSDYAEKQRSVLLF